MSALITLVQRREKKNSFIFGVNIAAVSTRIVSTFLCCALHVYCCSVGPLRSISSSALCVTQSINQLLFMRALNHIQSTLCIQKKTEKLNALEQQTVTVDRKNSPVEGNREPSEGWRSSGGDGNAKRCRKREKEIEAVRVAASLQ